MRFFGVGDGLRVMRVFLHPGERGIFRWADRSQPEQSFPASNGATP